jgi:hypothetical protein
LNLQKLTHVLLKHRPLQVRLLQLPRLKQLLHLLQLPRLLQQKRL